MALVALISVSIRLSRDADDEAISEMLDLRRGVLDDFVGLLKVTARCREERGGKPAHLVCDIVELSLFFIGYGVSPIIRVSLQYVIMEQTFVLMGRSGLVP